MSGRSLAIAAAVTIALAIVPVSPAQSADEPTAPTPTTTAGPTDDDDGGGGFDTGGTQGGADGEHGQPTPSPPPPAEPGTWTRRNDACQLGGTGTCSVFVICADGSRAGYWVKMYEG